MDAARNGVNIITELMSSPEQQLGVRSDNIHLLTVHITVYNALWWMFIAKQLDASCTHQDDADADSVV